ncbi:MAG: MFS transporter, partial [Candidatus Binatia bacterium]
MNRLDRKGLLAGIAASVFVCLMIFFGSQGLKHFDLALTPYAFAVVFAAFAVTYRYVVWLQRPPTWCYWVQGWRLFLKRPVGNLVHLGRLLFDNFAAQRFIGRRSPVRWIMHFCLSWGVMIAFAITFPLVFGWIHFDTPVENPATYRLLVFGIGLMEFAPDSILAFLIFNGLNFSAVLVIIGLLLAVQLRMKEPGRIALQQ